MSNYLDDSRALRADEKKLCNCAQGVVVPFAETAGIDREAAYRVAANFGGGMKRAATCGAVTGGLMALGLLGADDPATISEYHRRIKENHAGCLECADLLRINREQGGNKKEHCDGMVFECVQLVEELLRERGKIK